MMSIFIMTDSLGNEPEGAMAKHYVLTKKRYIKNLLVSLFFVILQKIRNIQIVVAFIIFLMGKN